MTKPTTDTTPATCAECDRQRTDGDYDYDALQIFTGQPLGWYSGDDGELCGECMSRTIRGQP